MPMGAAALVGIFLTTKREICKEAEKSKGML